MHPTTQQIITQIHATPIKFVLEFAGSGSLALFWLHSVPGSSRTVLEATDRYGATSLADLIDATPEKFVAQETAEAMADAAYRRARSLSDAPRCIGVGCTATIATDRVKRGEHGCWVAVRDDAGVRSYGLVLAKGQRDRAGEEVIVSGLIVRAIAEACGITEQVPLALLPNEQIQTIHTPVDDPLAQLLNGQVGTVTVHPDGRRSTDEPVTGGLLSGSFNPLHAGHERLAHVAAALLELPVAFEIPIVNADKPPLPYGEVERRLRQFAEHYRVVLSRAPLFRDKARLFPGCVFVVGYDTAARLVDPKYYDGVAGRDAALAEMQAQGCRFLVAGRVAEGVFRTLADIAVPAAFGGLFVELPERLFRLDLSSSEIRARMG